MKYITRDFGEVEILPESIMNLAEPLLGFENLKQFGLIYDDEIGSDIMWMQALEYSEICFILMNPKNIVSDYKPVLTNKQLNLLKVKDIEELELWNLCVIPEKFQDATINLKSPIFINMAEQLVMQVVLEQDFPIRFPIMGEVK